MPRIFYESSPLLLLHISGKKGYRTNFGCNQKIANILSRNYGGFIIYQIHWNQCFGHVFGKQNKKQGLIFWFNNKIK